MVDGKNIRIVPAIKNELKRDFNQQKLRVAAYCRVSTDSEEQISSYKSQVEYYTTFIQENPNWKFAGVFADEGLSGISTKKREQFNKMMRKCRRGHIDLIYTKSVSRFARNTVDCLDSVRTLKNMGIAVIFEKEGINTLEQDETLLTMAVSFAQAESESASRNIKLGYKQKYKAGKAPWRPQYGYRKGEDGEPVIQSDEAAVVKRIFHQYIAGSSSEAIGKILEEDGISSPAGNQKWSNKTIVRMLKNEKYIGDVMLQKTYVSDMLTKTIKQNNGELPKYYIENNHPAIIDRELFNKVQVEMSRRSSLQVSDIAARTKTNKSRYSGKYALSELLICGVCGAPYRRVTWTRPEGKRIVWRCINRLQNGRSGCASETMDEAVLQDAITHSINSVVDLEYLQRALYMSVSELAEADTIAPCADIEKLFGVAMQPLPKYDDQVVRQAIKRITVLDKDNILVLFNDGVEVKCQLAYTE